MLRAVLVTGVSRHLGTRVARCLATDPTIDRVIGVDTEPPPLGTDVGRTDFVRVDLSTADIAEVVSASEADTVIDVSLVATPVDAGGRSRMKEINVIGAMQLLAACQRATAVRKLVVRSASAVYGSSPRDPALFTEETAAVEPPKSGYGKDAVELEGYVRDFARRRPEVVVSLLRFVNFIGPRVDSAITRYFHLPVVPTEFGFDPLLQFIHEDDGVEVLRRMAVEDHPGTYNVSAKGAMPVSVCIRRAGRVPLPLISPIFGLAGGLGRRSGLTDFSPEQLNLLRYGRVVDASKLYARLAWEPRCTTLEAFDDFLAARGLSAKWAADLVDRMSDALVRR